MAGAGDAKVQGVVAAFTDNLRRVRHMIQVEGIPIVEHLTAWPVISVP